MVELVNKKDCTGCMACAQICPNNAIDRTEYDAGFLYPVINNSKCINCGLCIKVCPQIEENNIQKGKVLKVYGVKHKNKEILKQSSSGAAFVILAEYIFSLGNSYVFGARFDDDFNVIHDFSDNYEGISAFKGSKYVQSDIKNTYIKTKELLLEGANVLFTGTPCQISGLKGYLGKDYDNLITVDLICHGVPTPKIWKDYVRFIEKKYGKDIVKYNLRSKWQGIHTSIEFSNGKILEDKNDIISYIDTYYHHHHMRPCCFNCKYANLNRISDITIGDFWGIEKVNNNFKDDLGVSVMIINSQKGLDIFELIKDKILYIESNTDECMQPHLKEPVKIRNTKEYKRFWALYHKNGYVAIAKRYSKYGKIYRIKLEIKKIIRFLKDKLRPFIKR